MPDAGVDAADDAADNTDEESKFEFVEDDVEIDDKLIGLPLKLMS